MSSATDRLATSLTDRYRIEHELGAGGMATVVENLITELDNPILKKR